MRQFLFILLIFSLHSCVSDPCGSKDQLVENFDAFVKETKVAAKDYSETDWVKREEKFEKMTKDCYQEHKKDMSSKEKRLFWKDAIHFMILKGANDISLNINTDEDDKIRIDTENPNDEYIANEIEEVFEGTGEELEEIVDDFLKNDAPELIDKALEALEKFAEELKESLKEEEQ